MVGKKYDLRQLEIKCRPYCSIEYKGMNTWLYRVANGSFFIRLSSANRWLKPVFSPCKFYINATYTVNELGIKF